MPKRAIIANRFATPGAIDPEETGWRTRGYLPHFDDESVVQLITFRLAGSIPQSVLRQSRANLTSGRITDVEYFRTIEKYLDDGHGARHLSHREIAAVFEENLLRFDGERYHLFHWVVMPTHAHVMLRPNADFSLARTMHSMKSYTANEANKILGRSGRFWSVEYFDRYIRDGRHFGRVAEYVHNNPVKAGLCETSVDLEFGCAGRHG
jgi:putative DNA methylase